MTDNNLENIKTNLNEFANNFSADNKEMKEYTKKELMHFLECLAEGKKSSISTGTYEKIIEQLIQSKKNCKQLKWDRDEKRKQLSRMSDFICRNTDLFGKHPAGLLDELLTNKILEQKQQLTQANARIEELENIQRSDREHISHIYEQFGLKCIPNSVKNPDIFEHITDLKKQVERMKSSLEKIREIELASLDIDWDEYEAGCRETDYSAIITNCEVGLGEAEE